MKKVYLGFGVFTETYSQEMCERVSKFASHLHSKKEVEEFKSLLELYRFDGSMFEAEQMEKSAFEPQEFVITTEELDEISKLWV